MERYDVQLLPRALQDLDSIYSYIAQTLVEPETALHLAGELEEGVLSLETLPQRCPERRTGVYANRGYRQLLIKNYTIVFRIDERQKQVLVLTVRYAPSQF